MSAELLAGRYELVAPVGKGATGQVWRGLIYPRRFRLRLALGLDRLRLRLRFIDRLGRRLDGLRGRLVSRLRNLAFLDLFAVLNPAKRPAASDGGGFL